MLTNFNYSGFCTLCNFQIPNFEDLTKCPNCGTKFVPCSNDNQVNISINTHELCLLCIWAENWGNEKNCGVDIVYAIARRIRKQLGEKDTSLTLADGFQELKDVGVDFETNHPAGQDLN